MSFDYDPYSGIELARDTDTGLFRWHCHSCGGGWRSDPTNSLLKLWNNWTEHLEKSHNLLPKHTESWSKLE